MNSTKIDMKKLIEYKIVDLKWIMAQEDDFTKKCVIKEKVDKLYKWYRNFINKTLK